MLSFKVTTLDDAMHIAFKTITEQGEEVLSTKGRNWEIRACAFELTNPRARLSSTKTRGKPMSCLGELFWYLSGKADSKFISYYVKHYESSQPIVNGAYEPRLFNWRNLNQVENIVDLLTRKPGSRQAVIQLFDASDVASLAKDIPCTCTLQFFIRNGILDLVVHMRSNDAFLGLPHDVFCFTMLQEIFARKLSVEMGTYTHMVGSLHLYETSLVPAKRYLKEGWQPTNYEMPPMPPGDPWPAIETILQIEEAIRCGKNWDKSHVASLDSYWQDIVFLLRAFRCKKDQMYDEIKGIQTQMNSDTYVPYLEEMIRSRRVRKPTPP